MITRCNNGHWYDTSASKACPHCKRDSEKLSICLDNVEEDDRTISIAEVDLSLGEELGAIIGGSVNNISNSPGDLFSNEDGDKTISFGFFGVTSIQPVVGWLVCMTGGELGKDYRLHTGKNFIGRSTSMDVVLVDDKTVSRDKHCSVTYDPKGNTFYISAEKGNIVYLNKERVQEPIKLQNGDQIHIGDTILTFIAFCEEERTWEKE